MTTQISKPNEIRKATFLLIHGGWHGGWCWQRVADFLRANGHEVYTPSLTGLGDRVHLTNPEVGLDTHIQDVLQVLKYEDLSDVILVGHSYAGMVIAGSADKAGDRISHLVFLDAFVPHDGQSVFDLAGPQADEIKQLANDMGDGWLVPPFPIEVFGLTAEEDIAWVAPRLVFQSIKTLSDPVELNSSSSERYQRSFIYLSDPAIGTVDTFANMAKTSEDWDYYELATGHDAMVTRPRELAEIFEQISQVQ